MNVEFLSTELAERTLCPTSAIGRIDVSTDDASVRMTMQVNGREIYSSILYAYNGTVSLFDAGHLIETYFRAHSLFRANVSVKASCSSDSSVFTSMTIDCLHCSHVVPESFDASQIFFSCLRTHRVARTAKFKLYGPMAGGVSVIVNIAGLDPAGNPTSGTVYTMSADGYIDVDIPSWISSVVANTAIAVPTMMSIRCNGMEKTLYIARDPEYMTFTFRNCFNVPETIYLPGQTVMKPEVSVDDAVCSGRTVQYNRVISRSYEFTSGPLTRHEVAALAQFLESQSVSVVVDDVAYEIVITDQSTEISSDASSLNVLKFPWQFADRRPHLFGDDLDPLLYSSQIFTEQFQQQYM